jgi:HD-GYP domain-containing protein (c-di-GMP phosphodiesterase class II)
MRATVHDANEPSIVDREPNGDLARIAAQRFRGPDGAEMTYLTEEELHFLELRRGTLDDRERAQAEYHAEATYRLLRRVLWTDDLKNVANYAYGHHEKLDGTGYPRRLRAPDIPLQMRMVGLCDMSDALTQADRPYKHALLPTAAFAVLRDEANAGRIDAELLRILRQSLAA